MQLSNNKLEHINLTFKLILFSLLGSGYIHITFNGFLKHCFTAFFYYGHLLSLCQIGKSLKVNVYIISNIHHFCQVKYLFDFLLASLYDQALSKIGIYSERKEFAPNGASPLFRSRTPFFLRKANIKMNCFL